MRIRTKICGITRVEDALAAAQAGVDAIGLVFYQKSPRAVSMTQAAKIIAALPPFVSTVGLFVNAPRTEIDALLSQVSLDVLQFHGDETPAECEGFSRPYYRALRMQPGVDIAALAAQYSGAQGILLDAWVQHLQALGRSDAAALVGRMTAELATLRAMSNTSSVSSWTHRWSRQVIQRPHGAT